MLIVFVFIAIKAHKMIKHIHCFFTCCRNIGINKRIVITVWKHIIYKRKNAQLAEMHSFFLVNFNRNNALVSSCFSFNKGNDVFNSFYFVIRKILFTVKWFQCFNLACIENARINNIFKVCFWKIFFAGKDIAQPRTIDIALLCKTCDRITAFFNIFS